METTMSAKKLQWLIAVPAVILTMFGLGAYFGLRQTENAGDDRISLSQKTLFFLALAIGFLFVPLVAIVLGLWIASSVTLIRLFMLSSSTDRIEMFLLHGFVTAAALKLTHVLIQVIGRAKEMTNTLDLYFRRHS